MPSKKPFAGYKVGQTIWQHASYSKDAWRGCTITHINQGTSDHAFGSMRVKQLEGKKDVTLWGGSYHSIAPYGIAQHVPPHTIYLLSTKIGEHFNWRFKTNFEVYTCCTRMQTAGQLLGFLITPADLYEATDLYKHPAYKTWIVAPNLGELFSFLGNKLSEIEEVYKAIHGKQEANVPDNIVQAD